MSEKLIQKGNDKTFERRLKLRRNLRRSRVLAAILLTGVLSAGISLGQFQVMHRFVETSPLGPSSPLLQGTDGNFYGTTGGGGSSGNGTVIRMDSVSVVTTMHSFDGDDGAGPNCLIQGSDGDFYGTTAGGGASGKGTIFRMDASGVLTTLYSFSGSDGQEPNALLQDIDGNFYGTTGYEGPSGSGTVFRMNPAGVVTTLHSFDGNDGSGPTGLIQASDGDFYGTTALGGAIGNGTVFRMDASGVLTTLHSFGSFGASGGSLPNAIIQGSDGNFYGTTYSGGNFSPNGYKGTVFKMTPSGAVTTLHLFSGSEGQEPVAALVQGSDGNFYGSTSRSDPEFGGGGTIFRMDSTGVLTTLHSFSGSDGAGLRSGLIQASDGDLYGSTIGGGIGSGGGTLFRMDSSGLVTTLYSFTATEGAHPVAELVQGSDGDFYGTTAYGGSGTGGGNGTVFRMDSVGTLTTLHSFTGDGDGYNPNGLSQGTDGGFYGTTYGGGPTGRGTAFRVDSSGVFTTLHSFTVADGTHPVAALIQGSDGNFYGTLPYGGAGGWGTVIRMDSSGSVTTLHSFSGSDGAYPLAGLVQGSDGSFYGTTNEGGSAWLGTVFRMASSGVVTTLHSFDGSDGAYPYGLIQGSDGNIYGTTSLSPEPNWVDQGTVFMMSASGAVTTLHRFNGSDGAYPMAALLQASDGNLYGTTSSGGPSNLGTIFRMSLSGVVTSIHLFSGSDGDSPQSSLIQANDGYLYGTAAGGGGVNASGVVFRLSGWPDLTVTAFSAPMMAAWGAVITVTETTANGTTASPAGPSTTSFYLSNNPIWDLGDMLLGSRSIGPLPTGGANSSSIGLTIPIGAAAGNKYVIAKADSAGVLAEADETNNTRSHPIKIVGPDLIVAQVSAPSSTSAGSAIGVGDSTKNLGGAGAAASSTAIYLSTDDVLDAGDVLLGTRAVSPLAAGASQGSTTVVTIPAGTARGRYFLILRADDSGSQLETDETNNTRSRGIRVS